MTRRRRIRPPAAGCAGALLACLALGAGPVRAQAWSEIGAAPVAGARDTVRVREPFFCFLLARSAADSLGAWSGAAVREVAAQLGRPSRFPLEQIVSIERERPDPAAAGAYAGARVQAVWRVRLRQPQDYPMPYSILGYHPGTLRMAAELVLAEFAATDVNLTFRDGDATQTAMLTEVRIYALERGYLLLDADGLADALLGAMLDDAWVVGFATGRLATGGHGLLGVGVLLGRDGRRIFGEFDFTADRVLPRGGPLAAALSRHSRRWLDPALGRLPPPWRMP